MRFFLFLFTVLAAAHPAFKPGDIVPESYVRAIGIEKFFKSAEVPRDVFDSMKGNSYPEDCTVRIESLRYLTVLHKDAQGRTLIGELVAGREIATDLLEIFRELYEAGYPIEKMILIDHYRGNDLLSMQDNNSTCFNFRTIAGSSKISAHGTGTAVDINPKYNPYWKKLKGGREIVQPGDSYGFIDRKGSFPYKITASDLCCRLFKSHGFVWGGDWRSCKDYQHFEKKTISTAPGGGRD